MSLSSSAETSLRDEIRFGDHRLDGEAGKLWRGDEPVVIDPSTLRLLRFFLSRPGVVISKQELLSELWPGVAVSESALNNAVHRLRKSIGDNRKRPKYLRTVHRRGLEWIAEPKTARDSDALESSNERSPAQGPVFVGRETELNELRELAQRAASGQRQMIFIEGVPGVGKSSLAERFIYDLGGSVLAIRGQCVEHEGRAAPYHPVFEAVDRMVRSVGEVAVEALRRHAPTWLAQMPWLIDAGEAERLRAVLGPTAAGAMLRELSVALEQLASHRTLVLHIEDLHWADSATVGFLEVVAQRTEPARLIVIATYRPTDAIAHRHPAISLARLLAARKLCHRLALEALSEAEVREYLAARFGDQVSRELSEPLFRQTEGNPLFCDTISDHLVIEGRLTSHDGGWSLTGASEVSELSALPESLVEMIELQLQPLAPAEIEILEAASVDGLSFSIPAVAAAVGRAVEFVEETCEALADRWRLVSSPRYEGTWPDGTPASSCSFRHGLYRRALHQRLASGRVRRLHQAIGERLEQAAGDDTRKLAMKLAEHFEAAGDSARTARYRRESAEQALERCAYEEAESWSFAAIRAAQALGEAPDRLLLEALARFAWAQARLAGQVPDTDDDHANLDRLLELCGLLGQSPASFDALEGMCALLTLYMRLSEGAELADQLIAIAAETGDRLQTIRANHARGRADMFLGDFAAVERAVDRAFEVWHDDASDDFQLVVTHAHSWRLADLNLTGIRMAAQIFTGEIEEARKAADRLTEPALDNIVSSMGASTLIGIIGTYRQLGEFETMLRIAREGIERLQDQDILGTRASLEVAAWNMEMQIGAIPSEDKAAFDKARRFWERDLATRISAPYPLGALGYLYGCLLAGRPAEGLHASDQILARLDGSGFGWCDSEHLRLRGELLMDRGQVSDLVAAEDCFRRAIRHAVDTHARFAEWRAIIVLLRRDPNDRSILVGRLSELTEEFRSHLAAETPALTEALVALGTA